MARVFKRNGMFWIDFKDAQGVRRRKQVSPDKKTANEALAAAQTATARGEFLGVVEDSQISFADFAAKWVERVRPTLKPTSQARWFNIVKNHLQPTFSGSLKSVTPTAVAGYVARRKDAGASAESINAETKVLKHLLARAVSWGDLGRNPLTDAQGKVVEGCRALKTPSGRTRYLSADELERLLAECATDRVLDAFVRVALNTGMRRAEVLSLTAKSIDWEERSAKLMATKNGEDRIVPLNDVAFDALRSMPTPIKGGRIFGISGSQMLRRFDRARRAAKIEDFRLHDLRHTFASYQAMAGCQGRGLQEMLGHRDSKSTERYSHISDQYKRAAVDAVQLGRRAS